MDGEELMIPLMPRLPPEPSVRALDKHEWMGHAVCRSWCRHGVASKGGERTLTREAGSLLGVGVDYGFFVCDKRRHVATPVCQMPKQPRRVNQNMRLHN